ncbi:EmrB/QacA subfamily drug resistance transporter [Nakamurella sp. UYEF19]|uniref:DHA2 family efflux MFS transporter permease subunit n=1 Tax=Nakamurella sp. UYEF19 TaxID=1756392 RepID=UPI003393B899
MTITATIAATGGSPTPQSDGRRWKALALLATAEFIVVLDASIVNIALPDIGNGLQLAATHLAWIITAYVVAFGALLPLGGRLADLLGRRLVFTAGIGLFSLASLAAGVAPDGAFLITARALQGIGAAMLAPAALSLVTSTFREGEERTTALSIWGAVAAGGAAAGVLFGGLLTGSLGWRSVFLINVPIGIAVIALTRRVVPESRAERTARLTMADFDLLGATTVTGGLVAMVVGLSEATAWGWTSPVTLGLLAAGIVLLGVFVRLQATGTHPLIPLHLLTIRTVAAGNAVMFLTGIAMLGLFYFLSLYEQFVLGYGPITAGLSQLPLALALILAAGFAGPLIARFSDRAVLTAGLLGLAAGLCWFGLAPVDGSFLVDILGPSLLVGIGLGTAFVPITSIAVSGVPARDAGVAGGLVNTTQQIGGAVGLAALATLANSRTTRPRPPRPRCSR